MNDLDEIELRNDIEALAALAERKCSRRCSTRRYRTFLAEGYRDRILMRLDVLG